jgi:hypothetical protein
MVALLIVLAVVAATLGALQLSSATLGVGLVAIGCTFAILARIAQAAAHHRQVLSAADRPHRTEIVPSAPVARVAKSGVVLDEGFTP